MCYKDGPLLPPLDINVTINTAGRYVRFQNERLDGVTYPSGYELTTVYTELCEVIVYGNDNCFAYYLIESTFQVPYYLKTVKFTLKEILM